MKKAGLFLFFLLLLYSSINAQKVAVVLSGGGAKGLAHIGVLKVLEENNIPIDYVVGTSMGAIVGGFYSAGYSPAQIEQIVLSKNFQNWVEGIISDDYNYYFTKKESNASLISFDLNFDSLFNPIAFPSLANDIALNFTLTELLAQSSQKAKYNFDSLLIPFRAIASDIFSQEAVILKEGSLNNALRASFSVPFFYRPIKINRKFLFDGGVYNNFPVDVARKEFDPDVIIGVNVSSKRFEEYPYKNDEKLLRQSFLFMLLDKSDSSMLTANDVFIEPDLRKYNAFDFPFVKAMVDSGYQAATAKINEITRKIERSIDCESVSEKRNRFLLSSAPLYVKEIKLNGFSTSQERYIKNLFDQEKNKLDIHDLRKGYYKLISENYFKDIYPNIVFDSLSNHFALEIFGKPKKNIKMEFGGNISTRNISEVFLGIDYSSFRRILTNYTANFYTGRFYQSVLLKARFNMPYYKIFYIEPEFIVNKWDFISGSDIIFETEPTIISQIDRKLGVNLGIPFRTFGKVVINASTFINTDYYSNINKFTSTDTLDKINFEGIKAGVAYYKNSLNRKQYATSGSSINLSFDFFDGLENHFPGSTSTIDGHKQIHRYWGRLKFNRERYFTFDRFHPGYMVEAVVSSQPNFSNYKGSIINAPAFYPFPVSKTLFLENFRSYNYLATGARLVYTLKRNIDIRTEAYLFKPINLITEGEHQNSVVKEDFLKIFAAGNFATVYHSPIGPISLNLSIYDDIKNPYEVMLHVGYIIFNKRSLE